MKPKNKKHVWLYVVLMIVLLIVLALTIGTVKQSREKKKFENALNQISKPATITFKSKYCIVGNIDTADYCAYNYSSSNPAQSALDLANSAKQSGYDVHTLTRPPTPDAYIATNSSEGVKLRIDPGGANQLLVEVFSSSIQRDGP